MKICVTSKGENLDASVDPRFGRCKYFLVVDTESLDFDTISNESMMSSGGAGIQAAQMVAKTGAEAVITGNIGPNAFDTLKAAGINVITGADGIVKDVVEKFNKGVFKSIDSPNVGNHFGMNK